MLVKCVAHHKNSVMLAAPLMRMTAIKKKKKDENCASTMQEGVGRKAISDNVEGVKSEGANRVHS